MFERYILLLPLFVILSLTFVALIADLPPHPLKIPASMLMAGLVTAVGAGLPMTT